MICVAARELDDNSTLAVGTGAPCAAAMLAQNWTHRTWPSCLKREASVRNYQRCPFLLVIHEPVTRLWWFPLWALLWKPVHGDMLIILSSVVHKLTCMATWIRLILEEPTRNRRCVFREAAGERFREFLLEDDGADCPGCTSLCGEMRIHHHARLAQGGNSRYEAGLPEGTGPYKVFTNMAVMDFEPRASACA